MARFRVGLKDWDAPQDESQPIRLYPRKTATSIQSRLGRPVADPGQLVAVAVVTGMVMVQL